MLKMLLCTAGHVGCNASSSEGYTKQDIDTMLQQLEQRIIKQVDVELNHQDHELNSVEIETVLLWIFAMVPSVMLLVWMGLDTSGCLPPALSRNRAGS